MLTTFTARSCVTDTTEVFDAAQFSCNRIAEHIENNSMCPTVAAMCTSL